MEVIDVEYEPVKIRSKLAWYQILTAAVGIVWASTGDRLDDQGCDRSLVPPAQRLDGGQVVVAGEQGVSRDSA